MSNSYGTGPKAKATRLHSLVVRLPGRCRVCGATDNLQCAHILSRRYNATRTDETNAWCLCARCHFRIDNHFDEKWKLVTDTIGEDAYFQLKARAMGGVKLYADYWQDECLRLDALLAA